MARKRSLRQIAWEKSGGNCHLCGLPMQLESNHDTNPLAFTLEHITPKSKGGTNDYENIDGAHRFCNQFKGESLINELPNGWKQVVKWKIKNYIANAKV